MQARGEFRGDGRRVWRNMRPAYAWMMQQMERRLPEYGGGFPVWLWHRPRPDFRNPGHLPRGTHGVLIEVELPRERVLLSDFETWNGVLNRFYLALSDREERDWNRRTAGLDQYSGPLPEPYESELLMIWERIFELAVLKRSRRWGPINKIQAVTERVLLSEVRDVREFVAP